MTNLSPFSAVQEYEDRKKLIDEDGRNTKNGGFVAKPKEGSKRASHIASLIKHQKGQGQTPNMEFSSKISWLVRMIKCIDIMAVMYRIKAHKAMANLQTSDVIKLRELFARAEQLQITAQKLANEIAAWNKKKKMRKIVE
jgi:hypothetical protein